MKYKTYLLASNCKIIKGAKNSILIDLQRQNYYKLSESQLRVIGRVLKTSEVSFFKEDKLFFDFLVKEDIILKVPSFTLKSFKNLNEEFHANSKINNSIFYLNEELFHFQQHYLNFLNNSGCKFLELRINKQFEFNYLIEFIKNTQKTSVQSIDIFISFYSKNIEYNVITLKEQFIEIRWIVIYDCPKSLVNRHNMKKHSNTLYVSSGIEPHYCGNISDFYFSINIPTYTESLSKNTCLNCKLSIDKDGNIKNCPSMKNNFGNIKDHKLNWQVFNKKFTEMWNIKKDDVKICRDCEYRYICTDCRAYLEDPSDIYSKPLKCGYDPYTGVWSDWKTDPKKQKAITHYGLNMVNEKK